jgi:tripeptide aminopeptidase
MQFPDLLERFLAYAKIDTGSSEESQTFPSTIKQLHLAQKLKQELQDMGLKEAIINENGYVLATLSSNQMERVPAIALIAHMDTSPDVTSEHVTPCIHKNYNGKDIILSPETELLLKVKDNPELEEKVGQTIITTNGTTLLGADDKAGIAEIMSAIQYLVEHPERPRPHIRIVFTPDEEIGRGTDKITIGEIAADAGYTVDGGPVGEIEDETFCADSMKIKIRGVNVHPGTAKDKMINALKIASMIVSRFPGEHMSPETTENREGYIHPNFLTGTVEEAIIKMLVRDFTEEGLKEKEDFVLSVVNEAKERYPGATINVELEKSYRNMKTVLDKHPEVVEKAEEAIRLCGLVPVRTSIRGGTDGARLCFMGLPTPNLFTGGHNFHSRYEWISLEDMEKAAEVIVCLMELWAVK